jgi:hypothetical protein
MASFPAWDSRDQIVKSHLMGKQQPKPVRFSEQQEITATLSKFQLIERSEINVIEV